MKRIRALLPSIVAVTVVLATTAWLAVGASGFSIENKGTAGLDGKVIMSPAAERITAVSADDNSLIGPGMTLQRAIILQNRTDAAIDFDLDVAQVVGSTAELIVEVRHGVREGAAAWVTLERPTVRLKPGDQAQIGVTIKIPRSIKPGSKSFAVTATQRSAAVETKGAGIAPQFKQDAIFIVDLPGDAPVKGTFVRADITSASKSTKAALEGKPPPTNSRWYIGPKWNHNTPHRLTLTTLFRNEGERLLTPSGSVVVRDLFGRVAGRWEIKKFTVYPGGESGGEVELKGLPSLGVFSTKVTLESEDGKRVTTLRRFVMVPWWFIFVGIALLLYIAWQVFKWRLRRRREWRLYLAEAEGATAVEGVDALSGPGDDDDAPWSYEAGA